MAAPRPGRPGTTTAERSRLAGQTFNSAPIMLGDRSPSGGLRLAQVGLPPPGIPTPRFTRLGALTGGVKIADNQSPQPQDRAFFSFTAFDDLFDAINRRLGSPVRDQRLYREVFGVEKTFLDRRASLGLQLPLNTLSFDAPVVGGTSTALGDLTVILKSAVWQDPARGDLLSAGLAVTAPTGPRSFAGVEIPNDASVSVRSTDLQPFLGYIRNQGRWYLQGFLAISIPTDNRDRTLLYNDVGIGYFLYRSGDPDALITAIAPTLEAHVNTPLNHRSPDLTTPVGTADVVDLTSGINVEWRRRALLSVGLVTPVTGPRPFDYEVIALLNLRFGPSGPRRAPLPPTSPPAF